jgi:hypothetical protein
MLFSQRTLDLIVAGEIDRVYRRWKRPAVVIGTLQRTSHGLVEVLGVRPVDETDLDARRAGYATAGDLLSDLRPPEPDRRLYEIRVRWAGEDPRVKLRAEVHLDHATLTRIDGVVAGIGRRGAPTGIELLRIIAAHPGVVARDLASELGVERDILKRRVRQLKELGLTESLRIGYRLSPRGGAYLARARKEPPAPREMR